MVLRHSPRPRVRRGVVAAAVGGGTLISVLGVLLALVLLRPAPEPVAGESSAPSPSATADADPSGEPSSSPQPDPTSTPGQTEASSPSGLTNRAIADVAVAGLNLRREPGGGAEVRGTLDEGARVFVIGAPQLLDDVAWYRVAVVDGPYSGCLNEDYCPPDVGWVAEGGTAGGPLVAARHARLPLLADDGGGTRHAPPARAFELLRRRRDRGDGDLGSLLLRCERAVHVGAVLAGVPDRPVQLPRNEQLRSVGGGAASRPRARRHRPCHARHGARGGADLHDYGNARVLWTDAFRRVTTRHRNAGRCRHRAWMPDAARGEGLRGHRLRGRLVCRAAET